MLQFFSAHQASQSTLRFQVKKMGLSNTLCKRRWSYPESLGGYSTYGVVPGIDIDGKSIPNRFDLPLFGIAGRTNTGRVNVLHMTFLQAENQRPVKQFCCFRDAVEVHRNFVHMDASCSIIAATRRIFPTANIPGCMAP